MTGIEELAGAAMAAISDAGVGTALVSGAATAAAGAGIASLMAPKTPGVKPPVSMPDQQNQDVARRRALVEQMARQGRASTVLSDPQSSDVMG